jgi:hypothetical protein
MANPAILVPLAVGHAAMESFTKPISAELQPRAIALAQRAMYKDPLILPDVGTVISLMNRQMIDPELANGVLRNHGVTLYGLEGDEHDGEYYHAASQAWRQAVRLHYEVPGAGHWNDWYLRGLVPYLAYSKGVIRAGSHPDAWVPRLELMRERPGMSDVLDSYLRGRITRDKADKLAVEAGSRMELWDDVLEARRPLVSPLELNALYNRGVVTPDRWAEELRRHGFLDNEYYGWMAELRKGLPGVADLNMFGVRHSWQPELVERYGYYLEFPERLRPWYAKLGLDYGVGFQARTDAGLREVTLADAYWASHWHVLPLNAAFQAYQRFQPDLVRRFQVDNPALQPFTREDLNVHMRQADFPPGVRDWLTALAHPVLGRRDINWGAQFLGWDRAEMQARYRILGYTTDDSAALAAIAENREGYRQNAWARSLGDSVRKRTIKMIEGLYEDGTIDREFAMRQFAAAGLSAGVSGQLLDLTDFGVERRLVRAALSATGRDYLSGVLSRAEAEIQLGRIGVTGSRIQNYLHAWGIQRDARRKRLETGKIQAMVAEGLLSSAEARARLVNLQWSDPDATLLLAEAAGKLAKREYQEAKTRDADIRRRARELDRLGKEADAQGRKLRAEANRVAPRTVLLRWLQDGEISEDSFRSMMKERGYSDPIIDKYVEDSKREKPKKPRPAPTFRPFPRPEGSAHPGLAVLRKWFNDGVIDSEKVRDGIKGLGYSDSDTESFLRDWGAVPTNGAPGPSAG